MQGHRAGSAGPATTRSPPSRPFGCGRAQRGCGRGTALVDQRIALSARIGGRGAIGRRRLPGADAVELNKARCGRSHERGELAVEAGVVGVDVDDAPAEGAHGQLGGIQTVSPAGLGRSAAACRARVSTVTPRKRSRSSSGAVKPRWRIWLRHLMRTSLPERWATSSARIASTLPSAVFATPAARPDNAARAASTASPASDLPCRRRACRLGRSTSTTATPLPQRPGQPGAKAPVPSTPTRHSG